MADKKIKLEAVPDAPADLAPAIAKKVNESGVNESTKKKLLALMGKPDTETKLLKESAAKDAAEDLRKFKEKVLDKPAEIVAVEAIRTDVHEKILGALGAEFTAGGDKYKLEDLDKFKNALKKPDEKKPEEKKPEEKKPEEKKPDQKKPKDTPPDSGPPIPTGDRMAYSNRLLARAGLVGAGALGVGTLVSGIAGAAGGNSAVPMTTRILGGMGNFWGGALDIVWNKIGLSNVWNFGVNQATALASKLGITTGAGANTAALAGLPSWMAPLGVGLGIAGGAWLGSKLLNKINAEAGKHLKYEPWKVPFLGSIPVLGSIANAAVSPLQMAFNGGKRILGAGKEWEGKGVLGFLKKTWEKTGAKLWEHRGEVGKFGVGAGLGALILAALTGGSSILWGLIGGQAARGKFNSFFEKWIPAPLGISKSGGAAHASK